MGMLRFGYFFSRACMPGDTLSLYLSRFCEVIVNRGFSSLKGSTEPISGFQPAGALVIPPVHSGIVPSLLPARSAPLGVRSLPRRSTSAALIAPASGDRHRPNNAAVG